MDVDIPFNEFMELFREPYERAVKAVARELGLEVVSFRYYPSSNDNTHVYITVDKDIEGEEYLIVQFLFYNDAKKTYHNLKRFRALGDPLDLMFHFIQ